MITIAYSKTFNFPWFNLILQKLHEMIFPKKMCGMFLIFCDSRFIKFFETVKSPKVKYLETHLFLKIPHTVLKILYEQINRKDFFFQKIFFKDMGLFSRV